MEEYVSEIILELIEPEYYSPSRLGNVDKVFIFIDPNNDYFTDRIEIKVSSETQKKAKLILDIYNMIYRLEVTDREMVRTTVGSFLLAHIYQSGKEFETDGGMPIDKGPKYMGEVRVASGFKALMKRDFKAILEWMEKRIDDYARNLSEEDIEKLEEYVNRLRMKWNSYNVEYRG